MGVSFRSESSWQAANTRVTGRAHAPCRRPRLRPARPPRSRRGRPLAPRSPHPSRAVRLVRRGRGSRGRAGSHGRAAPRAQLQPRARRTAHSGDGACAEGVHGLCWDGHGRHRGAGGGGGRGGEGGGRFGWVLRAVSSLVSSRGPRFPARGERADLPLGQSLGPNAPEMGERARFVPSHSTGVGATVPPHVWWAAGPFPSNRHKRLTRCSSRLRRLLCPSCDAGDQPRCLRHQPSGRGQGEAPHARWQA